MDYESSRAIYQRVLDKLADPAGRQFSQTSGSVGRQVMEALRVQKDKFSRVLADLDTDLLRVVDETISTVSGQELYDLPDRFLRLWGLWLLDTAGGLTKLDPYLKQRREDQTDAAITRYTLTGRKLGLLPAPTDVQVMRLEYDRSPPDWTFGAVVTVTATMTVSITLAAAASAGVTSRKDDYYNEAYIYIDSGTGAGQLRRILDYNGTTRTATVSVLATPLDATSLYSIVSPFPRNLNAACVLGAAIDLADTFAIRNTAPWRRDYDRAEMEAQYENLDRAGYDRVLRSPHDYDRLFPV